MGAMTAHAKLDLNHGRGALQGPQFVGEAINPRPFSNNCRSRSRWGGVNFGRRPGTGLGANAASPPCCQAFRHCDTELTDVVPRCWGIQMVSDPIRYHRSFIRAKFNWPVIVQ
jgi:hypothetical protein